MKSFFKQGMAVALLVSLLLQSCYNPNSLVTRKNNAPSPLNDKELLSVPQPDDDALTDPTTASLELSNQLTLGNELTLSEPFSSEYPITALANTNLLSTAHRGQKTILSKRSNISSTDLPKYMQPLIAKGGEQVTFKQLPTGEWQAIVNEVPFPTGLSRSLVLPVFLAPGENIEQVCAHAPAWHKRNIQVVWQQGKGGVYVGMPGLPGGMRLPKGGVGVNSNSEEAEECKETPDLSQLSGKLQYLYAQDDKLPKLIEDEAIAEQSLKDYYVKLQVVLREDIEVAARDKVVGEKKPLEIAKFFDQIDEQHPAVGKVLLLGGAGIGKSTLMHYISYQWAKGKLWKNKYDHVFRVRLKDLLRGMWDYKAEEEDDLLAYFIRSCLNSQKVNLEANGDERISEARYDLVEIKELLNDPVKREKVLLLVDGYDEVASLENTVKYKKVLDLGVFKHPHVIMTSRPHAASKRIRDRFERQIESQGLDKIGISQYVGKHFEQTKEPALGEELQQFLRNHSQVMEMCEVPINTALLCIIWQDPVIRAKFTKDLSNREELKLGQLYHELVMWLGKRYVTKYHSSSNDPVKLNELSEGAILNDKVFKALVRVAYETFTNINHIAKKSDYLGIPGLLLDKIAKGEDNELRISDLQKYGLVRGEGNPNKPLEQIYYFIHLTFQEYLCAYQLCQLLSQQDQAQVQKVAEWIAHHRNDPKYLMMLKFLAGLVSQSQDELLVKRFWETVSCNVDGVLELGLEGKVNLCMHLLGQSQVGGNPDPRIPNLPVMQQLIDEVVLKDMVQWQQAIIESGYLSNKMIQETKDTLEQARHQKNKNLLRAAANIAAAMASRGVFGPKVELFRIFFGLTKLESWQIQQLGFEKAINVADVSLGEILDEKSVRKLCNLLVNDESLKAATISLLVKLNQIASTTFNNALLLVVQDAGVDIKVKQAIASSLPEMVKNLSQAEVKKVFSLVKLLLMDKEWSVQKNAAHALATIAKKLPQESIQEAFDLVRTLLDNQDSAVRRGGAYALGAMAKNLPSGGAKEAFSIFERLVYDVSIDVRMSVVDVLQEISKDLPQEGVKEVFKLAKPLLKGNEITSLWGRGGVHAIAVIVENLPQEESREAFNIIKPLLLHEHWEIRNSASYALGKIVKKLPQEYMVETLNLFKPLLADENEEVRKNTARALKEIVKNLPSTEAPNLVHSLLLMEKNEHVRSGAAYALGEIVKRMSRQEAFDLVKPLLQDQQLDVRSGAAYALKEIAREMPQQAFNLVESLLMDQDPKVYSSAVYALGKIAYGLSQEDIKKAFNLIKSLLDDDKSGYVREIAAKGLEKIVKTLPQETIQEGFNLIKLLLHDKGMNSPLAELSILASGKEENCEQPERHCEPAEQVWQSSPLRDQPVGVSGNVPDTTKDCEQFSDAHRGQKTILSKRSNVRMGAINALAGLVKKLPYREIKEAFNLTKPLLIDNDKRIRESTARALAEIIKSLSFGELVNLSSSDPEHNIRTWAKEALVKKFEPTEGIVQFSYKEIDSLVKIVAETEGSSAIEADLCNRANKALQQIANKISNEGIKWINERFSRLPSLPEVQVLLKSMLHTALGDGVIDEEEAKFIVNCIVQRGITAIIDPQENKILLEGSSYQLDPSSNKVLAHIVNEVIKTSKDAVVQQYRAHIPLFVNSGKALPVAAADIPQDQVGSIVDKTKLQSENWYLSVMDLSDHHKNAPSNTFLLLEQCGYTGDHIIYQIAVDNSKLAVHAYAVNPTQADCLREELFGKMEYRNIKPRYYSTHFTISQEQGEKLLLACEQSDQLVTDYHKDLHNLAASYVTGGDKLSAEWKDYVTMAREYKKDILLKVDAEQVRRDSNAAEQAEKIQKHEEDIKRISDVLTISGVAQNAEIKKQLEVYKQAKPKLFAYCATFIWALKSYVDAYAVASSGLLATNQESGTIEKGIKYTVDKAIEIGGSMIPIVGDFISILGDAVGAAYDKIKEAKQENKIAVINQVLRQSHTLPSEVEYSIARAALEIAKRKETSIINPPVGSKNMLTKLVSSIGERLSQLTGKLVKNHQLDESPQAELAVQDVVLLMANLYVQYEALRGNRSGAKLYQQMAELVCQGSLADMISQSRVAAPINLREATQAFGVKVLEKIKSKASKGLWKKSISHWGMECEEYFDEGYIIESLQQAQVPVNEENIIGSRIVLFKAMNEGIVAAEIKNRPKALQCVEEFGKRYPELTKLIARTYPSYFVDKVIAKCCMQVQVLLPEVGNQLPAQSKLE